MSHIDEGTLHAYLDGELEERQRERTEAHFAACGQCRERLDAATALIGRASDLVAELEPGTAQQPPWHEIEERVTARAAVTRRPRVRPSFAWAASIALAFGVGWASHSYWPAWTRQLDSPETGALYDVRFEPQRPPGPTPVLTQEGQPSTAPTGRGDADATDMLAKPPSQVPAEVAARSDAARVEPAADIDVAETEEASARQRTERSAEPSEARSEALPEPAGDEAALSRVEFRQTAVADRERAAEADALAPTASGVSPGMQLAGEARAEKQADLFFAVQPEEATAWLGLALRTLPDLDLRRVEVGPGSAVASGVGGLPAVRLVYEDAAGHQIVLIQQWLGERAFGTERARPVLTVDPSGANSYRWLDERGYQLTLVGEVSGDSLQALAERVR